MVRSLALALEARDGYTGEHSDAVEQLAVAVAGRLGLDARRDRRRPVGGAAARHRQDRRARPRAAQARPPRRRRVGAAARASRDRRAHPAPAARLRLRRHRRAPRARELGRPRLSGRPRGRGRSRSPRGSCWPATPGTRSSPTALPRPRCRSPPRARSSSAAPAPSSTRGSWRRCSTASTPRPAPGAPREPGAGAPATCSSTSAAELRVLMSLSAAVAAHELVVRAARPRGGGVVHRARRDVGLGVALGGARPRSCARSSTPACSRPARRRHPSDEIYRLTDDDPLKQLLLDGPLLRRGHRRPRAAPDRARSCSSASGGARAWPCRSCSATSPGGSCGRAATRAGPDFDAHDLRLLNAIAGQVAAGIGRAELFGAHGRARAAGRASPASPTGARSRSGWGSRSRTSTEEHEVTLLLCDVDNLKELNDVRGHHGGDWALKAVAGTLRTAADGAPARARGPAQRRRVRHPRRGRRARGRAARGGGGDRAPRPATGRPSGCRAASPPRASSCAGPPSSCAPPTPRSTPPSAPAAAASASPTSTRRRRGARRAAPAPAAAAATGSRSTPARCSCRRSSCSTARCAPPRRWSASRAWRPRSAPSLRASAAAVSLCPHGAG